MSCWGTVWLLAVGGLLLGYRKLRMSRHAQLTSNILIDALLLFIFAYVPNTLKNIFRSWTESDVAYCRFFNLISAYALFTLPWALVVNSIKVTLCAYNPLRYHNITTKWFFIVLVIFPWIFSLALMFYDINQIWYVMCDLCMIPMFKSYGHYIRFAPTSQFFNYILPATLILIFTIVSIIYTKRNVYILPRHEEESPGRSHLLAITLSAIALNLLYLQVITPWNIYYILERHYRVVSYGHSKLTRDVLYIIQYFFLTNIPLLWLTLQPEITLPLRDWLQARCGKRRSLQTAPQNLVVI